MPGRRAPAYPRVSQAQARITQVLPPKRWHCSLATFYASASEEALAQPLGPQAFFASMANAAHVLARLVANVALGAGAHRGGFRRNLIESISRKAPQRPVASAPAAWLSADTTA